MEARLTSATDRPVVLVTLPAGRTERRSAFAVIIVLLASFAMVAPFASMPLPGFSAFVPISSSVVFTNDLITFMLLMCRYVIVGWPAILFLAVGYLFTAVLSIIHLLTFPGVFTPTGLLGAGLQTTVWLYEFWHAGFPIAVILYVVLKDDEQATISLRASRRTVIAACLVFSVALVVVPTWISTAGEPYLPELALDRTRTAPLFPYVSGFLFLFSIVAFSLLWLRQRTVLDLWLMVAVCAWSLDIITQTLAGGRFSLGFYVGRGYTVIASTSVLVVLLWETMALYVRLAVAVLETDFAHLNRVSMMGQLAASLSHEITQPIASARNNARAGLNFLDAQPPDLLEVREALSGAIGDADRAGNIAARIRDQMKKAPLRMAHFDLNAAVNEIIGLARNAIIVNDVAVQTQFADKLAPVHGDRVQLQQVVLNLVLNAVEAMGSGQAATRKLSISTQQDSRGVVVAVRDSGPGIHPSKLEEVFQAFYTTKTSGTGMGLSICRSIVEAHGGRLWAEANAPCGAAFVFTLPGGRRNSI